MECPLGIEARDCEYLETTSKDMAAVAAGDLKFTCTKYDDIKDCPRMKALLESGLSDDLKSFFV